MERHFILNFTPTGLLPSREQTPNVPLLPREIVDHAQIEDLLEGILVIAGAPGRSPMAARKARELHGLTL